MKTAEAEVCSLDAGTEHEWGLFGVRNYVYSLVVDFALSKPMWAEVSMHEVGEVHIYVPACMFLHACASLCVSRAHVCVCMCLHSAHS